MYPKGSDECELPPLKKSDFLLQRLNLLLESYLRRLEKIPRRNFHSKAEAKPSKFLKYSFKGADKLDASIVIGHP